MSSTLAADAIEAAGRRPRKQSLRGRTGIYQCRGCLVRWWGRSNCWVCGRFGKPIFRYGTDKNVVPMMGGWPTATSYTNDRTHREAADSSQVAYPDTTAQRRTLDNLAEVDAERVNAT